jgi:hypothetical protein
MSADIISTISKGVILEFPLIYCNGDSYSTESYHPSLNGKTYSNVIAEYCNGFVINSAISGSCNRRIIRTTLHDLILQRQQNPLQKIIALINLSFELRSELWVDDLVSLTPTESNFVTHTFSAQNDWRENLLSNRDISTPNRHKLDKTFYEKFSQGRAFFFNPYAERINLLADLIMLKSTMDLLDIDFLIFQGPVAEQLESDYLLDFFKQRIATDPRIFDLETFGFCNWSHQQGFVPLDMLDRPVIGHYGPDAHSAFANNVLLPKLNELSIL